METKCQLQKPRKVPDSSVRDNAIAMHVLISTQERQRSWSYRSKWGDQATLTILLIGVLMLYVLEYYKCKGSRNVFCSFILVGLLASVDFTVCLPF
jgi:hypothetical protein